MGSRDAMILGMSILCHSCRCMGDSAVLGDLVMKALAGEVLQAGVLEQGEVFRRGCEEQKETCITPGLSQPCVPFCSWTLKMRSQTLMRMARTSTMSCTCLCDPQDVAPQRPHLGDSQTLGNPAPGPSIPQDPGMCPESLPMPGQWPLDFHRLDGTGFEVIITHSLSRVCLIFLVPPVASQATFTYLKYYQGHPNWKRFETRDRGLEGEG